MEASPPRAIRSPGSRRTIDDCTLEETLCMPSKCLAIVAVLTGWAAAGATAATVMIAPLKDNTLVQQTAPGNQQSGGQGDIFVGRTGQDGQNPPTISIRRGLIAFDIAGSVPAGATITGVSLSMRDVQGLNGDQTVSLHRLTQDWGEGGSNSTGPAAHGDATWLYRFFEAGNPGASPTWTVPGGDYAAGASGASLITDDAGPGQIFTWSGVGNPQLLADVQQWLNNPATNFGWILVGNESNGGTAKRLNSGETANAPMLRVDFVPEPSSAILAAAAAAGILRLGGRRSARRRPTP
jgi:hypothetical protein